MVQKVCFSRLLKKLFCLNLRNNLVVFVERKMKDLDRIKKTIFDLKDANRKIAADFDDNRETLGIVKSDQVFENFKLKLLKNLKLYFINIKLFE